MPRRIGDSVLCPGFVRTQITTSRRNEPARFERLSDDLLTRVQSSEERDRAGIEAGIDPFYVGELVREGIENDWPYIFIDTEFEPYVDARFAAIKQGFNRIQHRNPRC